MPAIITKYHGPGNVRGSRVTAQSADKNPNTRKYERLTLEYDQALSSLMAHAKVAEKLATRIGWFGVWVMSSTEDGYIFLKLPAGEGVNDASNAIFVNGSEA